MNVAIIPARGGSKRIPRKNIKDFFGKPMIAYSILAAKESGCFDRIIVSTDDEEIARVAIEYGAEVPFMRPAELSDDYTGTVPVIKHAIEYLLQSGENVEFVCCIYATAPFVSTENIRGGLVLLKRRDCDYTLTVATYPYPIQRSLRVNPAGRIEMLHPENWELRSQDLEEAYHDVGQFYWGKKESWLADKPILGVGSCPVIIPRIRAQDIDTAEDWQQAETIYKLLKCI
jgi:pseudaminic acid cytidylyltransferase